MRSLTRTILYFFLTVLITALAASAVTVVVIRNMQKDAVIMSVEEYGELSEAVFIRELADVISSRAYGNAPSGAKLIESAADGMIASLNDPYAEYYTEDEYADHLKSTSGKYVGVGMVVGEPTEQGAPVHEVYEDDPAAEAGVLAGDVITAIDGVSVAGVTMERFVELMAGEAGDTHALTVLRGEETVELTVTLADIVVEYVHYEMYRQSTGYVRIDSFNGNCAEAFEAAIRDLSERGMRCLLIDIRNNPGGLLDSVLAVADVLLSEGTILTIRGNGDDETVYTASGSGLDVPTAVLVNENSASASEVLAGALQDNDAAIIVGMPTYGKGVVQTTIPLTGNQGWVKLTTSAYFTPSGASVTGVGIVPDIEVDLEAEYKGVAISKLNTDNDAQLWEALDYIREEADRLEAEAEPAAG